MKRYKLYLINQETVEKRRNNLADRREFMKEFEPRFTAKFSMSLMLKDEEVTYILVRFGHIFKLVLVE